MPNTSGDAEVLFISGADLWLRGHGPSHPLKPERLQRTHELLHELGAFAWPELKVTQPRPANRQELLLFHTPQYVDAVEALSLGRGGFDPARYNFGTGDNPIFNGMFHSEGLKVGSALQAAQSLVQGQFRTAFSYCGGLHHAAPARASGFCVFNDVAVAIHWLKQHFEKILYLDVDVHHGDGVQAAFYSDPRVFTCSIHQHPSTLFPGTGFIDEVGAGAGEGFCANLPLPPGCDGENYQRAFRAVILPLISKFNPEIIVSQLGVDTHYRDPLAQFCLTTEDHDWIFKEIAGLDLPWLALGGGGYELEVVPRSWSLAVGAMTGRQLPRELPSDYRARYQNRWLRDSDRGERAPQSPEPVRQAVARTIASCRQKFLLD